MLRIDLGALSDGPIDMVQAVPVDDPVFEHLDFELSRPVHLSGRLMDTGEGRYYWLGALHTSVKMTCRRCLTNLELKIDQPVGVLFTEELNPDDPAAYSITPRATEFDPGEAVREELTLAVPEYALCSDQCRGICPRCGTDLNSGTCSCQPEPEPRWAELEKLKAASTDHEVD